MATEYGIPNSQLAVLDGGEVELAHSGGPNAAGLRFPFSSATKLFTATVAMQLVRDGDLELDAAMGRYHAGFAAAPNGMGTSVSLRHLLCHTSGLICDVAANVDSARKLLTAAGASAQLFAPGGAFSYSNLGFALVGRLIESATGMSWREAMDTFLLQPLGVIPAHLPGCGHPVVGPPLATGHTVTETGRVPVRATLPAGMAPAAALGGTAEDLLAFARLHLDERGTSERGLLDDEGIQEMRRPAVGTEPYGLADGWGLGWALHGSGDQPWLGLDAMGGGTTCNLRVHPQDGTVLVLLTDSTAGLPLWRDLTDWLSAQGRDVGTVTTGRPRPRQGPPSVPPRDPAGTWTNGTMRCQITHHADALRLEDDTKVRYRLHLDDYGAFSAHREDIPEAPYRGRFLHTKDSEQDGTQGVLMQFAGRVLRREASQEE